MQPADRAAEVRRAALFLAVSGVGTLADLAAVAGLLRLNTPILISVSVGWFVNVGVGYLLNRFVTFRDSTSSMTASTARYIVVVILSALIGIGGVSLAVTSGVPYVVARIVSSVMLVLTNLALARCWVFKFAAKA